MSKTTSDEREALIAEAMNTSSKAFRAALQVAMTAPIKTSIMYQNIGAKLLMVDSLPDRKSTRLNSSHRT